MTKNGDLIGKFRGVALCLRHAVDVIQMNGALDVVWLLVGCWQPIGLL